MTFASTMTSFRETVCVWLFMPVASLAVFWLARGLARRCGFVDRGDGNLKLQSEPVALLGGIGVLLVWLLGAVLIPDTAGQFSPTLVIAAAAITALGAFDDLFALSAKAKLGAQLVICGGYFSFGDRIDYAALTDVGSVQWLSGLLGGTDTAGHLIVFAGLMLLSVLIINAVNLLDGMDGTLSVYGISVASCLAWLGPDAVSMTVICIALCSFLIFNHPPATMYLGDAGSLLVGFLLFDALLQSLTFHSAPAIAESGTIVALLVLLTVPVCDTALAIFRRLAQGVGPMSGDRGHIHHRLQERARTTRAALFSWAAINATVVGIAVACRLSGDWRFVCFLPLVSALAIRMELLGHVEFRVFRQMAGEARRFLRTLLQQIHEEYSASRLLLHAESRAIVNPQTLTRANTLSIFDGVDDVPSVPRVICNDQQAYRLAIRFADALNQRDAEIDDLAKIRLLEEMAPRRFSVKELAPHDQRVQRAGSEGNFALAEPIALVIDHEKEGLQSTLFVRRHGRLIELPVQEFTGDHDSERFNISPAVEERRAA